MSNINKPLKKDKIFTIFCLKKKFLFLFLTCLKSFSLNMSSSHQVFEDFQQYDTFDSHNMQANNDLAVSYYAGGSKDFYHVMNTPQQHQQYNPAHQLPLGNLYPVNNLPQNQYLSIHPAVCFYRPPYDFYFYHVKCKEISYSIIKDLLNKVLNNTRHNVQLNENECIFIYQQQYNNRFYEVTSGIVSPSLITNYLNENVHGNIIDQNMEQEKLEFTFQRKENVEFHLTHYLNQ